MLAKRLPLKRDSEWEHMEHHLHWKQKSAWNIWSTSVNSRYPTRYRHHLNTWHQSNKNLWMPDLFMFDQIIFWLSYFYVVKQSFFSIRPSPESLPVLGVLEQYMTLNSDIVFLLLNNQYTIPRAGFDPPSAVVQTSNECEFDAFTLQDTTAGLL